MADIQFGVNVHGASSSAGLRGLVRRADELGFDVVAAPDHLGGLAPFAALAAAGAISDRLRLRTYVLNAGFWNPALLAREVATLDVLTAGRAELGLGAGHMKHEHDDAGLPWPSLAERVGAMEATILDVRSRLADEAHAPRPVQSPVPVMVGAMSTHGLEVAARLADTVAYSGLRQVSGASPGTLTLYSAAETAERVDQVRRQAAGRPYRSDALLQVVALGRDPAEAAAAWVDDSDDLSVAQALDSPFALFARTAEDAAEELRRRREVYGFDSVTTHGPSLEPMGEVIGAYRAEAGATR